MSVIYISSLQAGRDCLGLVKDRIGIDQVVTIDDRAAARAHVCGYADFADLGLPVRYVREYSMKHSADLQMIRDLAPRLIVVNGWNRLIPKAILDVPARGCVGFHGSWKPLPFGRGRSPVTWAILNGADRFFLHLIHLDEGVDSGDIIDTMEFEITPDDTCATVLAKIGRVSAELLLANVPKLLDGTAPRTPQAGVPTYLPRRTPEGGRIDWTMRTQEICNLVRAVTRPYGGAFSPIDYHGQRVTMHIWDAVPFSQDIACEGGIGAVVHELHGKPLIRCSDGILWVKDFTLSPPCAHRV